METKPESYDSVWTGLPNTIRTAVLALLVLGFAIFIGSFVSIGLALGQGFSEGLEHLSLIASSVVFAGLIVASVLLVSRGSKSTTDRRIVWLGNSWALFTIPLAFDFLVDSFYGKPLIMVLVALVGLSYWKGSRDSLLAFVVPFFTIALVTGDGLGHLRGAECVPMGFTGCPVKAVSDFYLLMILIPLTYATVASRSKRPSLAILGITTLLAISVFVGFGLSS